MNNSTESLVGLYYYRSNKCFGKQKGLYISFYVKQHNKYATLLHNANSSDVLQLLTLCLKCSQTRRICIAYVTLQVCF